MGAGQNLEKKKKKKNKKNDLAADIFGPLLRGTIHQP